MTWPGYLVCGLILAYLVTMGVLILRAQDGYIKAVRTAYRHGYRRSR